MPKLHYAYSQQLLVQYADKVLTLELFYPFPLIVMGVLRILSPLLVGVGIGLVLLPWLARWVVFGRPTRPTFIGGALALLGTSGLIGVWVSYDSYLSWPLFFTLLGSIALFFAIVNAPVSYWQPGQGLIIAAAMCACYFVGQYGHFYYPYEKGLLPDLGRLTGSVLPNLVAFTPHPNAVASFLASVWFLSLVLVWQGRGGKRVVWALAASIISYGLLISESRGAWLGLAIALIILARLLLPWPKFWLVVESAGLAGAVLGLCILYYAAVFTGLEIPLLSPTLNTAQSRLILYHNSLNLWSDYLFTGIGLGDTFAFVYSRYQLLIPYRFLSYAHNLFLSVGLSLGLLGLVALIWLLLSFYQFVIRVETKGNFSSHSLSLFRAAWLGATVTFIHGLTDAPQLAGSGWTMPMLFAVLGLVVATGYPALMKGEDNKEADEKPLAQNRWRGWVKGGAVGVLVVIALVFWRPLVSAWYANLGTIYQTRAELSPNLDNLARQTEIKRALDYFAQALNLNPAQVVANRRLGLIALDRGNFEAAAVYLEQAYQQGPNNQATLKALGFTYLWLGRLDDAEVLLQQVDNKYQLIEELQNWSNWRASQGEIEFSNFARDMVRRLSK